MAIVSQSTMVFINNNWLNFIQVFLVDLLCNEWQSRYEVVLPVVSFATNAMRIRISSMQEPSVAASRNGATYRHHARLHLGRRHLFSSCTPRTYNGRAFPSLPPHLRLQLLVHATFSKRMRLSNWRHCSHSTISRRMRLSNRRHSSHSTISTRMWLWRPREQLLASGRH